MVIVVYIELVYDARDLSSDLYMSPFPLGPDSIHIPTAEATMMHAARMIIPFLIPFFIYSL